MRRVSISHNIILVRECEIGDVSSMEGCPYAVLLSAREIPSDDFIKIVKIYESLWQAGAKFIVCVGENSEKLHDSLDRACEVSEFEGGIL